MHWNLQGLGAILDVRELPLASHWQRDGTILQVFQGTSSPPALALLEFAIANLHQVQWPW